MKKVIAIFAVAATLVACGGNKSEQAATTDSTAVAVDSAVVAPADTVAVDSASVVK